MSKTLKLLVWAVFLFASFLQADNSVDASKILEKRKYFTAFKYDACVIESRAVKAKINTQKRSLAIEKEFRIKFMSETRESDFKNISDYEIENYPKYISVYPDVWDERALDELESAVPFLKFKKKPADWRVDPKKSDRENLNIIDRKSIYEDLQDLIYEQNGQTFSIIKWADLNITGWPDGVPLKMSRWNLKAILSIYRNLNDLKLLVKNDYIKLNVDEITPKKALDLHNQIMDKFERETNEPREHFRRYKFIQWPTCVPQIYTYWDKEAIDEIERIVPELTFEPKSDWGCDVDRLSLHNELQNSILETINAKLKTNLGRIPWKSLNFSDWPEGISKGCHLRSQLDTLRIYRALPKMNITFKTTNNFMQDFETAMNPEPLITDFSFENGYDLPLNSSLTNQYNYVNDIISDVNTNKIISHSPIRISGNTISVHNIVDDQKSIRKRALKLHNQIMDKFEQDIKESREVFRKYKFVPWPPCVPQSHKFWDKQAIDEIKTCLPGLKFELKYPEWKQDRKHFDLDRNGLRNELYNAILKVINDKSNVMIKEIPWKDIAISDWPQGISKCKYFWSLADVLRIYRALPEMEFRWKIGDSMNENINNEMGFKEGDLADSNLQHEPNNSDEYSISEFLNGLEYDLDVDDAHIPKIRASSALYRKNYQTNSIISYQSPVSISHSLGKIQEGEKSNHDDKMTFVDDSIYEICDYLALEYDQSNQNDFFNQE